MRFVVLFVCLFLFCFKYIYGFGLLGFFSNPPKKKKKKVRSRIVSKPGRDYMKSSQVLARGTARSSTRGRARAQRHRIEIKRELSKIGPRFLPSGRGDDSGADFSPLQFHSFLSFVCLRLFYLFLFVFRVFALLAPKDEPSYTWKRWRGREAAPARAPLCSGLQEVSFGGKKG